MKLVRLFSAIVGVLFISNLALAANSDDALVEEINRYTKKQQIDTKKYKVVDMIEAVQKLQKIKTKECKEEIYHINSSKFATSLTKDGVPCKIYDLSFPTMTNIFDHLPISSVPIQRFKSRDYVAWLKGDYEKVYNSVEEFEANFNDNTLANSWASKLVFKTPQENSPVKSFRLSELVVGRNFKFNREQKNALRKILKDGGITESDHYSQMINNPESILEKVKIDWNPINKAYDIFIDFNFLPFNGPVVLVDYQVQYRYVLEKLFRSVIARAFDYITRFIPEPTTQAIVKIALAEGFESVNMAYEYHLNALQDTLEMNLNGTLTSELSKPNTEKAINILFAQRSNILMEYLMGTILGQNMDLDELHKTGARVRYQANKLRDSSFANYHSNLVLKKGCDVTLHHKYFGVCSINGEKKGVYSFLSEHKIFFINLGAPMIQNYAFPAGILLKRSTSALLAVGLKFFTLPIPGFLQGQLVGIAKGFAKAGVLDEAFLLNYMTENKRSNNSIDEFSDRNIKWLFLQNLNPFLAKSNGAEERIINSNFVKFKARF